MGLFSSLKKLVKKVIKGVGKIFKPITDFIGKLMQKKWFKYLMIGAADAAPRTLDLSLQRQNILVSNIANLDTPGFTPSDIDFSAALREALTERVVGPVRTHPRHISPSCAAGLWANSITRPDIEPGLDGNSVDLDLVMRI